MNMNKFEKIYKNIINESYLLDPDHEFDLIFMHHVTDFIRSIENGEGWINENEVLFQFLNMFDQYRSPLINQ